MLMTHIRPLDMIYLASVVLVWSTDCVGVVEVPWLFSQQENSGVRFRRPVRDRLRHGVGASPNDFAAEIPAVCTESERKQPRLPEKILRFGGMLHWSQCRRTFGSYVYVAVLPSVCNVAVVGASCSGVVGTVRIPDLDPKCAVVPQHATYLTEHSDQPCHPLVGCFLQADLMVDVDGPA